MLIYLFKNSTYLGIAALHLVVEDVEECLWHGFPLAVGDGCYVRVVRFLHVPQGEEIAGLDERGDELGVAQGLDAGLPRVLRMIRGPFPVRVFVHHLRKPATGEIVFIILADRATVIESDRLPTIRLITELIDRD